MTIAPEATLLKRWEQKELVQALRREGLSYREILSWIPFSLSRSTISNWCKEIELTPTQLDRLDRLYREGSYRGRLLGPKATQRRRIEEIAAIRSRARLEAIELTQKELWVAGLMLYWAEGTKARRVGISNSDPKLINFAMRWFREICKVSEDRFRAQLHLHSGQHEQGLKEFWSYLTRIPLSQFIKSFVKPEGSGHRKNRLYYGTLTVRIHDHGCLQQILGWIEGISEINGPLAQLVEHLTLNQGVDGSSPSRPTHSEAAPSSGRMAELADAPRPLKR